MLTSALATCSCSAGSVAGEARDHLVIDIDRLLAALELAQRDALVDQRPGDLFLQRRLGGVGEARDHLVVDRDRLLASARVEPSVDALVDQRLGDRFAKPGSVAEPNRVSTSS